MFEFLNDILIWLGFDFFGLVDLVQTWRRLVIRVNYQDVGLITML